MGNLFVALADLVGAACGLLSFAIVIRAVVSWFQPNPYSTGMRLLTRVTDPILLPIQRLYSVVLIRVLGQIFVFPVVC